MNVMTLKIYNACDLAELLEEWARGENPDLEGALEGVKEATLKTPEAAAPADPEVIDPYEEYGFDHAWELD